MSRTLTHSGGGEVEGNAGACPVLVAEGRLEGEGDAICDQLGMGDRDALREGARTFARIRWR